MLIIKNTAEIVTNQGTVSGLVLVRQNNLVTAPGLLHITTATPLDYSGSGPVTSIPLPLGLQSTITKVVDASGEEVEFTIADGQILFGSPVTLGWVYSYLRKIRLDCGLWQGNPITDIQIGRSLGQPSTLSLKIHSRVDLLNDLLTNLKPGNEFTFANLNWSITDLAVTEYPRTENPIRLVSLAVQATSKWANYLQPVPWVAENQVATRVRDINEIVNATRQCLALPSYRVVLPEVKQRSQAWGDWSNLITDIATIFGAVLDWDGVAGIGLTELLSTWSNPSLRLTEEDLRSSVQTSLGTANETRRTMSLPSVKLNATEPRIAAPFSPQQIALTQYSRVFDYQSAELQGEIYTSQEAALQVEISANTPVDRSFIRRQRVYSNYTTGSAAFPSFMRAGQALTELSVSFDQSGYTTEVRNVYTVDGQPLREEVTRYGIIATGRDIRLGANLLSLWGAYERFQTTHEYGAYGYYLGYKSTGQKLVRFYTEDVNSPETLPSDNADYTFQWVDTEAGQRLTLQQAGDFYLLDTRDQYYLDSNGIPRIDPTYIPEYLVVEEEEWSSTLLRRVKASDARLTEISGADFRREMKRTIHNGLNTIAPYFQSAADYSPSELEEMASREFYDEVTTEFAGDGEGFRSYAQVGPSIRSQGRPPTASRLQALFAEEGNGEDENPSRKLNEIFQLAVNSDAAYTGPKRGTVSFNGARTIDDAKAAARVTWLLNNVRGNTISITTNLRLDIKPGQYGELTAYGFTRRFLVLSAEHTIPSLGDETLLPEQGSTSLQLGWCPADPNTEVDVSLTPRLNASITLPPYYVGSTLVGSARPIGRSRYNS